MHRISDLLFPLLSSRSFSHKRQTGPRTPENLCRCRFPRIFQASLSSPLLTVSRTVCFQTAVDSPTLSSPIPLLRPSLCLARTLVFQLADFVNDSFVFLFQGFKVLLCLLKFFASRFQGSFCQFQLHGKPLDYILQNFPRGHFFRSHRCHHCNSD